MTWLRVGNFYKTHLRRQSDIGSQTMPTPWGVQARPHFARRLPVRSVEFRNISPGYCGISAITVDGIHDYDDGSRQLVVSIQSYGEYMHTIYPCIYETMHTMGIDGSCIREFDHSFEGNDNAVQIALSGNSLRAIHCLKLFFRKCNEKLKLPLFTSDLIEEISRMATFTLTSQNFREREIVDDLHLLPEISLQGFHVAHTETHVNPERESSKELCKILYKGVRNPTELYLKHKSKESFLPAMPLVHLSGDDEEKLQKLLSEGEDPNQRDDVGVTPLMIAILFCQNIKIITLLLVYYADPFFRYTHKSNMAVMDVIVDLIRNGQSSVERVYASEVKSLIEGSATTKIGRPLPVTVEKVKTSHADQSVQTRFDLSDGECIQTELKAGSTLTELLYFLGKQQSLFGLGSTSLKRGLHLLFDYVTRNFLIEMIRNKKNELVGFATYQFIINSENNHVDIYYGLQMADESLQSYRLMSLLSGRLAWVLQVLLSNHTVWGVSGHATYQGYRQIKDTLHFPMYQTPELLENAKKMSVQIFKCPMKHDGKISCVVDGIESKEVKPTLGFYESFFEKNIRKGKVVFSRWPFGDELFQHNQSMASSLKIDFAKLIAESAKDAIPLLMRFFPSIKPERPLPSIETVVKISRDMFFQPQKLKNNKSHELPRAKL
jgi:hypothetical protein